MYFTRLGLQQRGGILTGETTVRVHSKTLPLDFISRFVKGPQMWGCRALRYRGFWIGRVEEKKS